MSINKRELVAAVLAILTLVVAGFLYLTFGNRQENTFASRPSSSKVATSSSSSATSPSLDSLRQKLTELEKNPTVNAIADLKKEIDDLTDAKTKDALKTRLAKIESELPKIAKATKAVEKAESSQLGDDIDAAQKDINALTLPTKKAELQKRLTALANALGYTPGVEESQPASASVTETSSSSTEESSASLEVAEEEASAVVVTETPITTEQPVYVPTAPAVVPVPAETPVVITPTTPSTETPVVEVPTEPSSDVVIVEEVVAEQ